MGNAESSSQFPPPSNNNNGGKSSDEDEEGTTAPSALKIGAAVAGSALLAFGAYAMASSSSSDAGDVDGGRKRVTQMHGLEPEGFVAGGGGGGSRGVDNHRGHGCSNQSFASQTIKIMSYNVWFREDVEVVKRMKAIGQLIEKHRPDIIFFQEVTPKIYGLFQRSDWWAIYAYRSVPPEKATRRYFCMMLCKLPVKRFMCEPFGNSHMGREICVAEIDAGARMLVAATSHLESPTPPEMNSAERVAQAREAIRLLNSEPNAIFGGDMNWDDASDGPFPLLAGWRDAWSALRRDEGWTYDTKSNPMLKGNRPLQKRLDRFACRMKDFRMASVDMIGRDAIPGISYYNKGKELPVLPSDHYGLLLTIRPI